MKIIFLNTWNAKVRDNFVEYLKKEIIDTDIFCFQEAYSEMQQLCNEILVGYTKYIDYKFVTEKDDFAQAIYVRNEIKVVSYGTILKEQDNCGIGLYIEAKSSPHNLFVCNFHGMSRPVDKLDNPSRLIQSKSLVKFFKNKAPTIIGGDFNVLNYTNCIRMFSEQGYRDLIKDFRVKTTRNHFAWDRFPESKMHHSSYVFLSPGTRLKSFLVPDVEVSDHQPLELEVDI